MTARVDNQPARFLWLPPGLRPPVGMVWRQERIFLLVGMAALFAGYDVNIYGLAIPQIQASFHIPENQVALIAAYFRLAAFLALLIAASADLVGRRRLLLFTLLGQAIATFATGFTENYSQFVWAQFWTRVFGYSEEMLCFVVVAEEMAAAARGWATGTLAFMDYTGAGVASIVFAAVNLLPFGWRAIYAIGALPLFFVAYLRRRLPETQRFEAQAVLKDTRSKLAHSLSLIRDLVGEHPGRLMAILTAVAGFGFALSGPAMVLAAKYLQSVQGYTPGQITLLFVPGGLVALVLTILAGRLSDRWGRRPMAMLLLVTGGIGFFFFYGSVPHWLLPPLWVISFFACFSGQALLAGFALEIVPTRYRATVSGLRYLTEVLAGAVALVLEGHLYDRFQAHGPAIQLLLIVIPVSLVALFFLPEPARKSLEEMAA